MRKSKSAFTIVELLIVIVVIGILAAIVIVAYNGVQNRANDAAVQADLRNLADKVLQYQAIHGQLPSSGGSSGVFPGGIRHAVNKKAYSEETSNLYYCLVPSGTDARFSISARSKSGRAFSYFNGSLQDYPTHPHTAFSASVNICPNTGIPTTEPGFEYHYGFNVASPGTWQGWTAG